MGGQQELDFLNEGLDGRTEYRFYWDRDVLAIWFYVGADRKRKTTSIERSEALTSAWRAEARQRAAEIVQHARSGRVLVATQSERVQVSSTIVELRDAWLREQELAYPASIKTRRIQSQNVVNVFSSMQDELTPLQRMVDDRGPQMFVTTRMRQVAKDTVIKEVGILFQFLTWLHEDKHFITGVPPRPKYRKKDLGTRVGPQRDEPVHLEDDVALRIIMHLPEYALRGSFGRHLDPANLPKGAFVLRDWMRFAFETGLRPSTVARLQAGVHWVRGTDFLRITSDIDKGRNAAQKGRPRHVPLTKVAKDILTKHAPKTGIIFGKPDGQPHDIRIQWKRAATLELGAIDGARCAPYDLRHGANYRMRDTVGGSLAGSMHMVGHSKASTNDLYMRGTEKAAYQVVDCLNARNAELEGKSVRKPVRKRTIRTETDS